MELSMPKEKSKTQAVKLDMSKRKTAEASKTLEVFPNPKPGRRFDINMECPEFTCVCPMTGQPDFATIRISYTPDQKCIELKSLKLYLWSFRNEGHFHEAVTNMICDDLVKALNPHRIKVEGDFAVRGGIKTTIVVEHAKKKPGSKR